MNEPSRSDRVQATAKALGFFVVFCLIFYGLRRAPLPGLGGASEPVAGGIIILAALLLIAALLRWEGGRFRDIGLGVSKKVPLQFLTGLVVGVVLISIMIGVLLVLSPVEIRASENRDVFAMLFGSFLILFVLALMEEIGFRSYGLFRLQQAFGTRMAVYLSSIVFAFYHGLDLSNLLGPGVWGLFFAWMAFSTNSIALPTGFHLGLNWAQAMLGMKPQYSASIWELSLSGSGFLDAETTGLLMQLVLLVIGLVLVERLVRNNTVR